MAIKHPENNVVDKSAKAKLNWNIGKIISENIKYGNSIISNLAHDILKHETDNPSIGIMLCKTKDKLTAKYALKYINKPIGVSGYKLTNFV